MTSRGVRTDPWVVLRAGLGQHAPFIAVLVAGLVIRGITMYAYRPGFMFFGDSFAYIVSAQQLTPPNDRPFGYAGLLRLVSYVGDLQTVVLLQHLAGVGLAIAVYAVLMGRGTPRWIATLAATPLLLDAYLIQIEHSILSETMFAVALTAAVLIATRSTLTPVSAATIGGLLAFAAITRTVAIPIAAIFVGYLLVRRVGWRPLTAFATALAVPVLAYMGWFASVYGVFGTSDSSGRFLYGRVAVFADCSTLTLTDLERRLCDTAEPDLRPNANFYVWSSDSPVRGLGLPGRGNDEVAASFSKKVVLDQPLTYARYAATDVAHYFAPGRYLTRVDSPLTPWLFPETAATSAGNTSLAHNDLAGAPADPTLVAGPAEFLRAYQSVVYTQGPLLLGGLVLGLGAGWWARGARRWDGPFAATVGLSVLVIPSLTVMFDYRYGLPAIGLLAYAGGIGATELQRWRQRRRDETEAGPGLTRDVVDATSQDVPPSRSRRHGDPARTPALPLMVSVSAVALIAAIAAAPMARNTGFERYVGFRAELGSLGPALSEATPVPNAPGLTEQAFVAGSIVASNQGAVVVPTRYREGIKEAGGLLVLGQPRAGETASPYTSGERLLRFENGAVFWSRTLGARAVWGDLYESWNATRVKARLKEPIAPAIAIGGGAAQQEFVGGQITRFADGSVEIRVTPSPADRAAPGLDDTDRPASSVDVRLLRAD